MTRQRELNGMAQPDLDPRILIHVAFLDAIDELIRERCGGRRTPDAQALARWVEERNRVARLLGRPEFDAAEILVRGEDD